MIELLREVEKFVGTNLTINEPNASFSSEILQFLIPKIEFSSQTVENFASTRRLVIVGLIRLTFSFVAQELFRVN